MMFEALKQTGQTCLIGYPSPPAPVSLLVPVRPLNPVCDDVQTLSEWQSWIHTP